jgi:hypothetical protein
MASKASTTLNLQLPNLPEEVKDPQVYMELVRVYNACKILAQGLDAYTGVGGYPVSDWPSVGTNGVLVQNQTKVYVRAGDTFSAGKLVSFKDAGGVTYAYLALASSNDLRPCHGFATGPAQANGYVEVVLFGLYPFAGGLTTGQKYYLSNSTYGAFTAVNPSGANNIRQGIGYAINANTMFFNPAVDYITLLS